MIQDFSLWEFETYQRSWDICIVGSGINGLSTGISILEKRPDLNVLVIDRWFIPLGASTRNAGFSCFGSPSEILYDIATMGESSAISLVHKRWQGLQKLQKRLQHSNAQYETNGGYELFSRDGYEKVDSMISFLNDLMKDATGLAEVFRPVAIPDGIRNFDHAIYNPYEGQLHPGHMMEHLKKTYLQLGGHIYTGLQIDAIEDEQDKVILRSKLAIPLEAKQVVVTTNAFAKDLVGELDMTPARNHVMVTEPLEGLLWKGCFHFDKGFYYFRNIGNRILIGGARNTDMVSENTDQFGQNKIVINALENFLYEQQRLIR